MEDQGLEMGREIGRVIGAFFVLLIITRMVLLAFGHKKYTIIAVAISLIIGVGVITAALGFNELRGNPDLGGDAYANAAATLLIPAAAVFVIDLIRLAMRKGRERDEAR